MMINKLLSGHTQSYYQQLLSTQTRDYYTCQSAWD